MVLFIHVIKPFFDCQPKLIFFRADQKQKNFVQWLNTKQVAEQVAEQTIYFFHYLLNNLFFTKNHTSSGIKWLTPYG